MTEQLEIAVLTAVLPTRAEHLPAASASVAATRARLATRGWSLRWIVAVDGPGTVAAPGSDDVVVLPVQSGISAARNAALARAWGAGAAVVVPLDADDLLDPDGVLAAAELLVADPQLGWIVPNRLLVAGGARTPHWHDEQRWAAGELARSWTAPFPFHPNDVVARTELLAAVGGWPAVDVNEDLAAALLLSEAAPGASIAAVVHRYRTWEGQTVAAADYPARKQVAFTVIAALINARRTRAGRPIVCAPGDPGGAYGARATTGGAVSA